MRHRAAWFCAIAGLVLPLSGEARPVELTAVCFTPGDDCAGLIVRAIAGAAKIDNGK
jgi:hypothetical protein